jgi:autotransporter-associated beta strand protein
MLTGVAGVILSAIAARSQTAVWTGGGGGNTNFSDGANWLGGSPPPNDGSHTLGLNQSFDATITIDSPGNVAGIVFQGPPEGFSQYVLNDGGHTLTIGSGGISIGILASANLYFSANIILAQNQTWNIGFVNQEGGVISGTGTLTTTGSAYMFGDNTFSGGVNVQSGVFYVGSGASAGTGRIALSDNVSLDTFFSPDSLSNPVFVGNNVTIGTAVGTPLTLTGPVTFANATTNLILGSNSILTLTGAVGGPATTDLTIEGPSTDPILPTDGGSQVILQGTLNQVSDITASGTQLILAPTGNPATSLSSLAASGVHIGVNDFTWGYLGLDGTFATTSGAVANFLSVYGSGIGSTIVGTLGFDTTASPLSPQTFSDPINLSNFTSAQFLGLGSATSAILSGTITPTPLFFSAYVFGGGGGTLTVTSDLNDVEDTSLVMTNAPAPLTLILQGANNYLGTVQSNGGVLIFDSTVLPGSQEIALNNGYVGDTETPGLTSAQFLALFATSGTGVVGFDQHTLNLSFPRQISDTLDFSVFNGAGPFFLGTATAAELMPSATLTPANNQYMFTGVKGGVLTVDTQLTDATSPPASNSLTLGLVNPIESNGSTSIVNLTGNNTFTGGTTFNSGTVFINSNTAFGTGAIVIPDTPGTNISPYLASYGGTPVTITNPISVGSRGGTQGVSLGNVSPSGSDMLILSGVISDESSPFSLPGIIAIGGPVTLGAANTYSGGTIFTGIGNAEALINNSMAFGSGNIMIQDGSTIAPLGAAVAIANQIQLISSPLNLGQGGNTFLLTLNGAISGNGTVNIDGPVELNGSDNYSGTTTINGADVVVGAGSSTPFGSSTVTMSNGASLEFTFNPAILDLAGDTSSSINLAPGQTITLDADVNGGVFNGSITGDGSNGLAKIDTGIQQLNGTSTYGGGTTVQAGVLIAGSSGSLGTGTVTVASGATLGTQSGAVITNSINLGGNATLSGSGTYSPVAPIFFGAGDTVMPGNPISGLWVSTLSFGTPVTFATGGIYTLNVSDAGGVAGVDYSTIDVAGTLTITAAPGTFSIAINSITPGGGPGMATFNPMQAYSWTILSAGSISLFNANEFAFNTANFQNPLSGGTFAIAQSGSTLTLDFTPVPEPSTWMLMLTGLATVGAGLRRRRSR